MTTQACKVVHDKHSMRLEDLIQGVGEQKDDFPLLQSYFTEQNNKCTHEKKYLLKYFIQLASTVIGWQWE